MLKCSAWSNNFTSSCDFLFRCRFHEVNFEVVWMTRVIVYTAGGAWHPFGHWPPLYEFKRPPVHTAGAGHIAGESALGCLKAGTKGTYFDLRRFYMLKRGFTRFLTSRLSFSPKE